MATDALPVKPTMAAKPSERAMTSGPLFAPLRMLASLKLTVALFAAAIVIILIGTLAQDKEGMWVVMAKYFRSWIAWIAPSVFFPTAWFPSITESMMAWVVAISSVTIGLLGSLPCFARSRSHRGWSIAGGCIMGLAVATALQSLLLRGFLFPGGALIGTLMAVNLLAAHLIRFRVQAAGTRLQAGILVTVVGIVLTWLIIAGGHSSEGLQAVPIFEWTTLWLLCKLAMTAALFGLAGWFARLFNESPRRPIVLTVVGAASAVQAALVVWLWAAGESAYLGDAGMRILWQLIQGGLAGVVLLAGCVLLFKKRGGIVLIHAGIGVLMLGEWFVSWYAVEERLVIEEGSTANYAMDIRETELAIVDPNFSETHEDTFVVPGALLETKEDADQPISHPDLPFDVQVVEYMPNSDLKMLPPGETGIATAGTGVSYVAIDQKVSSGADTSGEVDMASAYVKFTEKDSGEEIGTYLVSQILTTMGRTEKVTVGDKQYDVSLRFKRTYKPYSMHLVDVRKDDYIGTSTPRNYSSDVLVVDEKGVEFERRIWMNNPLRFAGETFYQSGYHRDPQSGIETTTLQVVTNTGWMIPYVACMLVGIGMGAHFWQTLIRFLVRRSQETDLAVDQPLDLKAHAADKHDKKSPRGRGQSSESGGGAGGSWTRPAVWAPLAIVAFFALWIGGKAQPPRTPFEEFDFYSFGKIPVVFEGRVKPMDSLARNTLTKISDRGVFEDLDGEEQPAVRWLLDTIAKPEAAMQHEVFRIHNLDVLETLGLTRRKGFRYSLAEIRGEGNEVRDGLAKFDEQADKARGLDPEEMSFYQKKLLEVDRRFRTYTLLAAAFEPVSFPPFPTEQEFEEDREAATERIARIRQLMMRASQSEEMLNRMQPPLAVPDLIDDAGGHGADADKPWQPYATASNKAYLNKQILRTEVNPAVTSLASIFAAYGRGDAATFNREVAKYRDLLARENPENYQAGKVGFEAYFNHFAPFYHSIVLYVVAFVLAAGAWLGWSRPLNRAAFWLLAFTLCVHTFAIVGRIYISGRPPVTNLYSSAVFIGWACVLLGLILECFYRLGVGNVVAAVGGFVTLMIAQFLAGQGDTFTVLQAVLDTQFWLATHVVCITLGYATTFVAGLCGIVYIVMGFFTPALTKDAGKVLARMIYGTVCFAIIFSFIGTVLGGLWADDSWGRFWGWDPKENGALIIVLWNAIILHARWGGMVKERGLANLAVGGNIVTSWSWFGVNELGVGLHSYGFTSGVLLTLAIFVASQLAVIMIGTLPREFWVSFRSRDEEVVLAKAQGQPN